MYHLSALMPWLCDVPDWQIGPGNKSKHSNGCGSGTKAECCRCGSSYGELVVAHKMKTKANGVKTKQTFYIHDKCQGE